MLRNIWFIFKASRIEIIITTQTDTSNRVDVDGDLFQGVIDLMDFSSVHLSQLFWPLTLHVLVGWTEDHSADKHLCSGPTGLLEIDEVVEVVNQLWISEWWISDCVLSLIQFVPIANHSITVWIRCPCPRSDSCPTSPFSPWIKVRTGPYPISLL